MKISAEKIININVRVITNAKVRQIIEDSTDLFGSRNIKLKVLEIAENGKANAAVIKLLSEYLKVKNNQIKIVSGKLSKNKVISIEGLSG